MGIYEEQIKARIENDLAGVEAALSGLSAVVEGGGSHFNKERRRIHGAVEEILRYYHLAPVPVPDSVTGQEEQLEYLLRPVGIMRRNVKLKGDWYKEGTLPMLGETRSGEPVAIMPRGVSGYVYFDGAAGKQVRVTKRTAGQLLGEAVCFYRPLPLKSLKPKDLLKFTARCMTPLDLILTVVFTALSAVLGLLTPWMSRMLFGQVIPLEQAGALLPLASLMVGAAVSVHLFDVTRQLIVARIMGKINISVNAAAMARLLSLPTDFFKRYGAGDLASRVRQLQRLCPDLAQAVLSVGLTAAFSLVYVGQIAFFSPALALTALVLLLLMAGVLLTTMAVQSDVARKQMKTAAKLGALVFSLISGVRKLRLSGAEDRAFAKWAGLYRESAELLYNPPAAAKLSAVLGASVPLLGAPVLYAVAASSGVGAADYMAFNTAFGMAVGAVLTLSAVSPTLAKVRSALELSEPILAARPEVSFGKQTVTHIAGSLELCNLTFRYDEKGPLIIDDLSLNIRQGQYVALVGASGCGKSTLLRLLLGFETPQKGAIYCDGNDIAKIDLKSYRRQIGVVLQDGRLFAGDICSNIIITDSSLTEKDAWEAAEIAGIAEDIRAMPMGMYTAVNEGTGGMSGGQRQRLMIARAIAARPRLLLLDEATSALDNLTQCRVSEALDRMKCTRIVIAHRLSTIRACDRILVLDSGKIIEDGGYGELMEKGGAFAALVERQQQD